jgi:sugar/nucleoside kinase (ribokinase family)
MSVDVLTAGETMVLLDPIADGEIAHGLGFTLRLAGAESNFAVGLSRLGVGVTWVSRLGADPFGDVIEDTLEREGLDLRFVERDPARPTGVFFKWRSGGSSHVLYYRRGSAASALAPEHVPDEALEGVRLVHLTGITTALSDSARALVLELAARARSRGVTVLFDPNWRPALWRSPEEAAAAQREVLPYVDWYLCGSEEGRLLFGVEDAAELLAAIRASGAGNAVVRIGARGCVVEEARGAFEVPPARVAAVLDEVGAGDAFAAGFAYGLLQEWSAGDCARAANVIAAAALAGTGDWETLPLLHKVERELQPTGG